MPLRKIRSVVAALFAATAVAALMNLTPAAATTAAVSLSPSSGPAGSSTVVAGTGFPRKTAVTLALGASSVKLRTDGKGSVAATMRVDETATGEVTATVTSSRVTASARFTVIRSGLRFGVSTPGAPTAASELDEVARLTGESPSIVMFYRKFDSEPDVRDLDAAAAGGATPLLTWEPYDWTRGVDQPEYALARIIAGDFDASVRRWAEALKSWGKPVMLRFAHEMNGNWNPWSEGVNGNQSGEYVQAWRHVHGIFAQAGVTNVSWVWSPNISYSRSTPLPGLYPGDAYVDQVAVDGYNWGTAVQWHRWTAPADVFEPTLAELRAIAPSKPLFIAETASTELGGDKAAWIRDLFTWLKTQSDIEAVVWFHYDKETDWRINSSEAAATAFREALADFRR